MEIFIFYKILFFRSDTGMLLDRYMFKNKFEKVII